MASAALLSGTMCARLFLVRRSGNSICCFPRHHQWLTPVSRPRPDLWARRRSTSDHARSPISVRHRRLASRALCSVCGDSGEFSMGLLSGDSKPSFEIPKGLARKISKEFGFTLTKREIAKFETASRETIYLRRLINDRGNHEQSFRGSVGRHKRIATLADRLAKELQADEVESGSWCLRYKNNRFCVSGASHPPSGRA